MYEQAPQKNEAVLNSRLEGSNSDVATTINSGNSGNNNNNNNSSSSSNNSSSSRVYALDSSDLKEVCP